MKVYELTQKVTVEGIGLHSGAPSSATFSSTKAPGIILKRQGQMIPVRLESLKDTTRGVSLGTNGALVKTVEHLLAALRWLGIQNLEIEVEGDEIPVLDGSALPWIDTLRPHLHETPQKFPEFKVERTIEIEMGAASIKATPSEELFVSYSIDFPATPIGLQTWEGRITSDVFQHELAPARTFGFMDEVKALWKRGLAQGGNWENCVVISRNAFLTPLRFRDEMVRHKVLDLMGDLALLAGIPKARIDVQKGSHHLHTEMAKALLKSQEKAG